MTVFIDPHMAPILAAMRAAAPIDYAAMSSAEGRALFESLAAPWRALAPIVPHCEEIGLATPGGPLRARLYRTTTAPTPLILYIHGGGWTFGSIDTHESEMRHIALASGCAVLGFDYRLGPEHPFPAGLDDTLAALAAVRAGALGDAVDVSRIALAGDSAGANLALGALLSQRDARAKPVRAAALLYGCFTPNPDSESHQNFGGGDFGLSTARMHWYWRNFLGAAFDAPPAFAAPLAADMRDLPPLHLLAAGLDPLRDDTLTLARTLAGIGAPYEATTTPGVIHGFLGRAPKLPAAVTALRSAGAFLRMHLQ